MILSAESGVRGTLIDLDTGKPIRNVLWANLETGAVKAYVTNEKGEIEKGPDGSLKVYLGIARMKFIPSPHNAPAKLDNVIKCANTGEPVKQCQCDACCGRVPKVLRRPSRINVPLFDVCCEHYGCGKIATWAVSDEMVLPPVEYKGRKFERAKTIATHHYCSKHYYPSRTFDAKGELVSKWEEAMGVRPQ